jgi:hypothetical protein
MSPHDLAGMGRRHIGIGAACFNPHRPVIPGGLPKSRLNRLKGGAVWRDAAGWGDPGLTESPDAEEPVGGTRRSPFSQKTQHPAVFSWQTPFAGAALRILRSSRRRSRDRRKLEELLDFSPLPGSAQPQGFIAKNPTRRDFCRPGGAGLAPAGCQPGWPDRSSRSATSTRPSSSCLPTIWSAAASTSG